MPALIISMNALALSQQQRADALAQRAEDQREKAQAKAQADALAQTAFFRHVIHWYQDDRDHVRNSNPLPAVFYILWQPYHQHNPPLMWSVQIEPCTQVTIKTPNAEDDAYQESFALEDPNYPGDFSESNPLEGEDLSYFIDSETKGAQISPLKPERVIRGNTPCG
ncbi:hypothetical protein ACIBQ1_52565 [Nonomuraea sp. NPDC050153]|uniref:hypothetical protein n=1 Tax=Nonomuraea sp. NPDC050153 TaxID=3364359 RepID=UPI0037B587C9